MNGKPRRPRVEGPETRTVKRFLESLVRPDRAVVRIMFGLVNGLLNNERERLKRAHHALDELGIPKTAPSSYAQDPAGFEAQLGHYLDDEHRASLACDVWLELEERIHLLAIEKRQVPAGSSKDDDPDPAHA